MQIANIVRREKYDVVHVHGNSAMITPDLLGAKIGGARKIIAHSHNTTCNSPLINSALKPIFYHLYTDALACGKDAGKWMFGKRPFVVMKNGVFLEEYLFNDSIRNRVRKELNINNRYVIGHVGNFNYQKNHDLLIEVFNKYHNQNKESVLLLVGDGENRMKIEKKVSEMGLEKSVIFYGVSDHVSDLLMAMDCFVLSSRFEGLPCVLIEAQATGLPCIVSDKVSKESKMSDAFDFAKIDDLMDWTNKIENMRQATVRSELCKKNTISLRKHGYDISMAANMLAAIYRK